MSAQRRRFHILSIIVILTMLFPGVTPPSASAQGEDGIERQVNAQSGKVSFLGPESGQVLPAADALGKSTRPQDPAMELAKRFGPEFGLKDAGQKLTTLKTNRAEDGRITTRYQQTYHGIPILGGELIVNTNDNGDLYSLNGEVSADLSLSTLPAISAEQAKQTALQSVAKWYQKASKDFLVSEPALWVYDESLLRASTRPVELVWSMEVTPRDAAMPVRELVLVHAQRGGISLHFNQVDGAWKAPEPSQQIEQSSDPVFALPGLTWYVATTGRDSNSCAEPAAPCKTINAAMAKAPQWDAIIMVASGTYTGTGSNVVTVNKRLTLSGGWDSTFSTQNGASIIDGGGVRTGIRNDSFYGLVIDHFVIQNCHSDTDGGGLYVHGGLTLKNSSVINNTAGRGAGLFTYSYNIGISNTTISGNHATVSGGGIYARSGSLGLYNATIAYNHADQLGGGIAIEYSQVGLLNSIIADNSAITHGHDCYGFIDSSGYNIIGYNPGCSIYPHPGDQFNVDPLIDPSLTGTLPLHALQPESPAIDAGRDSIHCTGEDQRGLARPEGSACDIGAYEYAVPGLTVVGGSGQVVKTGSAFPLPFTVSVLDASLKRVPGVTVTFTAPATGASGVFADTGTRTTTVITDANGVATTSKFTTNATPGDYAVTASASGSSPVDFSLQAYAVRPLYVSTTGNDSNSCLAANSPCKTINAAIENARDGDTIQVAMGTYTSSDWVVVEISKSISLSGGWDASFTAQTGFSTIDGEDVSAGVSVHLVTAGIERFVIQNGYKPVGGGGGIVNSGTLVLRDSIVRDNTNWCSQGCDGGGGIANYGTLTVNRSTITGNRSLLGGAGILNYYGILTVNDSTVSGNQGTGVTSYGSAVLNGTTVSANAGGGILFGSSRPGNPTFTIHNTLVAGNWGVQHESTDCWGTIISAGYNLIGSNYGCTFTPTTGDKVGTSSNPIDPRLALLQNNGGLTLTHALLAGSPALDAGNPAVPGSGGNACPATDQRGVARPAGTRCDIGAFEGFIPWPFTPSANTYTANNGSSLPGTLVCNQSNPNCTGGDAHAMAAHRYAIGTYNLYAVQYGRDSMDNYGMTITSTVHYQSNYNNAFWDGQQMVYGDAYGFALADDVVAHELTHGVTQHESNLFYYYQSGAINESFSDLWGEYYDQTNGQGDDSSGVRWKVGEDISGWGHLRDMREPWRFGDPDRMTSTYYHTGEEDNGGVHHNSGINNHAVFMMVDGWTFNGKTVTMLGWAKTTAIYYEASTKLLTSGADYSDLYHALQQACKNLIGTRDITLADCAEVKDALDAVEMNGQPAPNFNTDAPLCVPGSSPIMFFADDLEAGTTNWTFDNGADTRWQVDSPFGPFAQSGVHSLFGDDYPDEITDATARLRSLTIPGGAYLHFAQAYGFESGYNPDDSTYNDFDGGVLEYSLNNGATWLDAGSLMDYNGYTGTLITGIGNPLAGRSAFVGDSHGYIGTRLNLSSLAGQNVSFRWRMGLDEAGFDRGWWVDNIKLYTCTPPPPGAFTKTSPPDGSSEVGLSTSLAWSHSPLASAYQYCYDIINDNQCNRTWNSLLATTVGISNLGTNTTYYWQVRAVNAAGTTYADSQSWGSFTTTSTLPSGMTDVEVFVGTNKPGKYSLGEGQSLRESYTGVNQGPVILANRTAIPLIGSERVIYKVNGVNTSFSELMGLPSNQLDMIYWLPWYNTKDLDTQLRIANVNDFPATVQVWIAGSQVTGSPFTLPAGESMRRSFPGVNGGPVKIVSDQAIVAAERVIYKVNGVNTSFSEMMALPDNQLDTTYWLPWYNNVDLDTQLRFANVSGTPAQVRVYIGGEEMHGSPFTLLPDESTRQSFAGINNGPVKIESDVPIIAAARVIYKVNGVNTSFSETMALPNSQLDNTYWLPWYNNVNLDTQLRFANVHASQTAQVHVYIGGVEMRGSPFTLLPGQSTRQSFPNINSGPVQIVSNVNIVAAERVIYKISGVNTSFSEMMALPASRLDTTYWFPWYNNVDLDTQLRFGVP